MKPTVLLVHGAWHNAAGFNALRDELNSLNINSEVVELSSVGSADAELGDMYTDAAIVHKAIESIKGDCVVIGHSYGGVVITEGAAGCSNVKKLIYMTAFMLDVGESLFAAVGSVAPVWWQESADKSRLTAADPEDIFYNMCAPDVAKKASAELRTQSLPAFNQPLTQAAWKEFPSTYIICEQDHAIPLFAQEAMSGRATNVVRIESDHSPFLCRTKEIAQIIDSVIS
jgi:pimeloyl-ACP methyl ester carboxylesterase